MRERAERDSLLLHRVDVLLCPRAATVLHFIYIATFFACVSTAVFSCLFRASLLFQRLDYRILSFASLPSSRCDRSAEGLDAVAEPHASAFDYTCSTTLCSRATHTKGKKRDRRNAGQWSILRW
jgi:hypothetical protein